MIVGDPKCKNCGGYGYTIIGNDPPEQDPCSHCEQWCHKLQEIKEALARGYCHDNNKDKVLDPSLIEAMANELMKLELL